MSRLLIPSLLAAAALLGAGPARAIIFISTGDSDFNAGEPTGQYASAGWQYQGQWGNYLGTPIAPKFFITAKHLEGVIVGSIFTYQGKPYTTIRKIEDPTSDLVIWEVSEPFPNYATVYYGRGEVGKEAFFVGRGVGREDDPKLAGKGWRWGANTKQRWGTNTISSIADLGTGFGETLRSTFDLGGGPNEATFGIRDSGGGLFIKDTDGVWKLAGINAEVTGPYKYSLSDPDDKKVDAALYDQSGLFVSLLGGGYGPASGPGAFYATRLSSHQAFIHNITGLPEPSSAALLAAGGIFLANVRARRR